MNLQCVLYRMLTFLRMLTDKILGEEKSRSVMLPA
nr:MAG TPA: hypothetical protein [Caudoviricetes sp.]